MLSETFRCSKKAVICLLLKVASFWPLYHQSIIDAALQRLLSFQQILSQLSRELKLCSCDCWLPGHQPVLWSSNTRVRVTGWLRPLYLWGHLEIVSYLWCLPPVPHRFYHQGLQTVPWTSKLRFYPDLQYELGNCIYTHRYVYVLPIMSDPSQFDKAEQVSIQPHKQGKEEKKITPDRTKRDCVNEKSKFLISK